MANSLIKFIEVSTDDKNWVTVVDTSQQT